MLSMTLELVLKVLVVSTLSFVLVSHLLYHLEDQVEEYQPYLSVQE
jgi:hypothetical protein